MRKFYRVSLSVCAWVGVVAGTGGCGNGGVVQILPQKSDVRISPQKLIQRLELTQQVEERESLLTGLLRRDSQRFDWAGFWQSLSTKPLAQDLYQDHAPTLRALAEQYCEGSPEFLTFLLAAGADGQALVQAKETCNASAPPPVTLQIAEKLFKSGSPDGSIAALAFLRKECESASTDPHLKREWAQAFHASSDFVQALQQAMLVPSNLAAYFDALVFFREKMGIALYPKSLLGDLAQNRSVIEAWMAHFASPKNLELLLELQQQSLYFQPTPGERNQYLAVIEQKMQQLTEPELETFFVAALKLVSAFSTSADVLTQLRSMDRLLLAAEKKLVSMERSLRENLLQRWLAHYRSEPEYDYLQWLAVRHDANQSRYVPQVRTHLSQFPGGVLPCQKITRTLLEALVAPSADTQAALLKQVCNELGASQIPTRTFSSQTDFGLALEAHLDPGCYQLPPGELNLSSPASLSTSFATVLLGQDQNLTLKAPSVSLSAVQLDATLVHPRQATTPKPAEADAYVVPIAMGFKVPSDQRLFKKGSHFLVFHHVLRPATSGALEGTPAKAGVEGHFVQMENTSPALSFTLVAAGGVGQQGAVPQTGGKSDTSYVHAETLRNHLRNTVGYYAENRPVELLEAVTPEMLGLLFAVSARRPNGELNAIPVPDYFDNVPAEQREKLKRLCVTLMNRANMTDNQYQECYLNKLLPAALKELRTQVDAWNLLEESERTTVLPVLSAGFAFEAPAGKRGPGNPDGPQGKPGSIRWVGPRVD